jgi:hypothetical protein
MRLPKSEEASLPVKNTVVLIGSSLFSIVFATCHLAHDIVLKMSSPGLANLFAMLIFATWLYGTLALAERRAGYVIVLLGSLFGLAMPVVHMNADGGVTAGDIARSGEAFFFVWTILALGVTATCSAVLSARALWSLPWRRQR